MPVGGAGEGRREGYGEVGEVNTDKDYVDLILIERWLDANGWDKLGTEQMYKWMEGEGMRRDELTVIRCQMPDYA